MIKEKIRYYCEFVGLFLYCILDVIGYIITKYIAPPLFFICTILYYIALTR